MVLMDVSGIVKIAVLVGLECLLSLDNALVLALAVKHLEPTQRMKALTYGVWGAFFFRLLALFLLKYLMGFYVIRILGGGYLVFKSVQFFFSAGEPQKEPKTASPIRFWATVMTVELLDIAFSIDSILAGFSVSNNYWILVAGGIIGILSMRFAATAMVYLIQKFPKLERAAYWIILGLGGKLAFEGFWDAAKEAFSPDDMNFGMEFLVSVLMIAIISIYLILRDSDKKPVRRHS